jgi:hypothetical protein
MVDGRGARAVNHTPCIHSVIRSRKNHNIKLPESNQSFKIVAKFTHWRETVRNQNYIYEYIKRRLSSESACYRSVYNF